MDKLTLQSAVSILQIEADTSKRKVDIPCPYCCKGKEKKLNVNFEKNLFRCNKCGISGGPINFWAIYRGFSIPSSSDEVRKVSRDYYEYMGTHKTQEVRKKEHFVQIDQEIAPISVRNKTYHGLIDMLTLSDKHKENLLSRGLSEESIARNEYRTYPLTSRKEIASSLLAQGFILDGVPGFYKTKDGRWTLRKLSSGFLIPQRDGKGRIQGFQVRLDNAQNGAKYITLSSAEMQSGAKGGTFPHLAQGEKGIEEVIITEGPLKAEIISQETGYTVFAITGVNCLDKALSPLLDLKEAGMRKMVIAYDMDLMTNLHVEAALKKLKDILSDFEISHSTLMWDPQYKGLDDYLTRKKEK